MIELTDLNFEEVIRRNRLVLVNFYATWSPLHRLSLTILNNLEKKFAGRLIFAKANIDKNENSVMKYDVKKTPTFIIFKDGLPIDRIIGYADEQSIENKIRNYLSI